MLCADTTCFYAGSSLEQVCSTIEHIYFSNPMWISIEVFLPANMLWRIASFKDCSFCISCFESKLSPQCDTLMCNEGIARSDHVSPRSILPEINGRQAPCLPTRAADGPRSVLGYTGVSIIGLLIERWFLCGCTMPEREIVVFFKELHREQGIVIFALSS